MSSRLIRKAAAESMVLLKNNGVLPLQKAAKVAVFGRCQADTFFVGYGSGGEIRAPYKISVLEGLKQTGLQLNETVRSAYETWCTKEENIADPGNEWGKWPYSYPEMPLTESFVKEAAKESETAIVVIGRAAGEDRENKTEEGIYYLTGQEREMLRFTTKHFKDTIVVLNCGNIIDFSWMDEFSCSALVMMWLGGMEAGNALADILTGAENPSGKMAATVAKEYKDYPSAANFGGEEYNFYEEDIYVGYRYFETFAREKIRYAFGYGLSYTSFDVEPMTFKEHEETLDFTVLVRNSGKVKGKELLQLYVQPPQGKLGKEVRRLLAFQKTDELLPGEEREYVLTVSKAEMASFDDEGKTGFASSFVLEEGEYWFFFGVSRNDGRLAYRNAGGYVQKKFRIVETVTPVCPPQHMFGRMSPDLGEEQALEQRELLTPGNIDLKQRILDQLPEEIPFTGDKGILFSEVCDGTASMEAFVAQLTDEELESLTRGEGGTNRPSGVEGNTGVFGGFLPSVKAKGVPVIVTSDGPAGIRLKKEATLLPCGTALACTFHPELIEKLYEIVALELEQLEVDVFLAPGLNIHRNPLCGRNFEYYSEDPYLSGKMAAAAVRGIQSRGRSACPKHFAANNQEVRRFQNDSRMSERALREIYLKGFEICVKEGKPKNIMTSYNKINGVWSHYNFDLATTVLRGEWGYQGNVMTDWWMQKSYSPEFPKLRYNAYRVRAQVDLLMPGNENSSPEQPQHYVPDETLLETLGEEDGITRAEIQRSAINVLNFAASALKARKN